MTLLLLSTDSVCLRTVVLIFCLPFNVFVQRVIVCWMSTFRSMAGHVASVPLRHNTGLIVASISSFWHRNDTSFGTISPLQWGMCSSFGFSTISILCEFSSISISPLPSSGIGIGVASDNDDLRDVIDMLSMWFGCNWDKLFVSSVALSSKSRSPCNDIWMMASFSIARELAFDWFELCDASGGCCWAWWGAICYSFRSRFRDSVFLPYKNTWNNIAKSKLICWINKNDNLMEWEKQKQLQKYKHFWTNYNKQTVFLTVLNYSATDWATYLQ